MGCCTMTVFRVNDRGDDRAVEKEKDTSGSVQGIIGVQSRIVLSECVSYY